MVSVGFPQKSTFTTLRATELICPSIDSGVGNLEFHVAGALKWVFGAVASDIATQLRLGGGFALQDAFGNTLVGHDGVGNINDLAPITDADGVRTPLVNNPDGDLALQRVGSARVAIQNTTVAFHVNPQLVTDRALVDNSGGVLIASDNAGHINDLARIDDDIKTPATSHYIASSIGPLVSPVQTGTITEYTGVWECAADDILIVFLGVLMGRVQLNATVHIDSVKVFYRTMHNDAYVDFGRVYRNSMVGVSTVLIGGADANYGDGNVLQSTFTIPVDAAMVADFDYYIEIGCEATAGVVKIYGIEVTYHTV